MSDDWKSWWRRWQQERAEEEAQRRRIIAEREAARQLEEEKAQEERERARYARSLAEHKAQYRCQCSFERCENTSAGPGTRVTKRKLLYRDAMEDSSKDYYDIEVEDDWGKPTNMYRCAQCKRWMCYHHIEGGICADCAMKKMGLSR